MFKQIFKLFKSDTLYNQALNECYEMLDIDLEMFQESIHVLRNQDDSKSKIDIAKTDIKINKFERSVRRKVMTHLAVSGTEDLGSGLILTSVVIDIERIGDYTKNIYDLSKFYSKRLNGAELEKDLAEVEENVIALFQNSIKAFKEQDIELARELMKDYKENISKQSDKITNDIISGKINIEADRATAIAMYSRYLKRIAAHSRNLISSIVNPFERIGYKEE
jgi:phosphate transport system protein|tara:strand:+ start:1290 stop:1955 length:666 start_codon:yes stop_codon:yes gene_type:complete